MKIVKFILYTLLIIVPFHFSVITPLINDVKFMDITLGTSIILFIYLFNKLRKRELTILKSPIDIVLYGFIAWYVITTILSDNPIQGFRNSALFYSSIVLFYLGRTIFKEDDGLSLPKLSTYILMFTSIYGIAQFYGVYLLRVPNNAPIISFFGNPNFAANFTIINMPLVVIYAFFKPFISLTVFALSYTSLIMFGTRGALIGFIISIILTLYLLKKENNIKKLILYILIIIVVVSILYYTPNPINTRKASLWTKLSQTKEFLTTPREEGSIKARFTFWKVALYMAKKYPLKGVGPGRFGYWYPFYQKTFIKDHAYNAKRVHNEYLQVLAETGIIGFTLFILFLLLLFRIGISEILKNPSNKVLIGVYAGIIAFCIHALFSFPFHIPTSMLYFSIFSAFIVSKSPVQKIQIQNKSLIIVIYFVLIIVTVFIATYTVKACIARYYLGEGKIFLNASVGAENEEELIRKGFQKILLAHYLDPYDHLSIFYLAKIYSYGKKYDKSNELYRKMLKMYSDYNAYFNMGNNYLNMGKYKDAIKTYEFLLSIKPDFPEVYNNLGIIYKRMGKYDKAIEIFKKGLKYKELPNLYTNLGLCYEKLGEYKEALKYLEKSLKLDPKQKDIEELIKKLKKTSIDIEIESIGGTKLERERISAMIRDIGAKIYSEYGITPPKRIRIVIENTSYDFERNTGVSGYYGGVTIGNTIYLKPIPIIEKYESVRNIINHEYIHVLLNSLTDDKPLWVQEGFAIYVEKNSEKFKPNKFSFISLNEFSHRGYNKNLYYNAYLKVFHLIETYGISKFVDFLKKVDYYNEKDVFKEIFSIDEDQFDKFLKNKLEV